MKTINYPNPKSTANQIVNTITILCTIFIFVFFSAPRNMVAQVAGTTEIVSDNIYYYENFKNIILDPSPVTGNASRVEFTRTFSNTTNPSLGFGKIVDILGGSGVSIPGWMTDLSNGISFFCSGIAPYFEVNGSVKAGGYYQIHSVSEADIDIYYPVKIDITYPATNSFACGDLIRINTAYSILEQNNINKLKVKPPFVNQELGPVINNLTFNASLGVDAWVGFGIESPPYPCSWDLTKWCTEEICGDEKHFNEGVTKSFGIGLPSLPPLVNVCESAFGPGANESSLLSCSWYGNGTLLELGQSALDAYNSAYHGNYSFAAFPDNYTVIIQTPDLPPNTLSLPDVSAAFKDISNTELNFSTLNGGKTLQVSGTKSEISKMQYDIVSLLDLVGYTTSLSMGGGMGSIDIGDISPTMKINQTLDFKYSPVIHLKLDLGQSMNFTVHNNDGSADYSGTGQIVELTAGQYITATYPQALSEPLPVSGNSFIKGDFQTYSKQQYFQNMELAFGKINIPGILDNFTLYSTQTNTENLGEKVILNHDFSLKGKSRPVLSGFTLDPENPIIDISSLEVLDIRNIGGGKREAAYRIGVTNNGDVSLNNVQVTFDLAAAFANADGFEVSCTASDGFTVNSLFNGETDISLLESGNTIDIGHTKYIDVSVVVQPARSQVLNGGCFGSVDYNVSAKAKGVSPIGTYVESNLYQCTMEIKAPDIIATIDLGAKIITELTDYTVYAFDEIKFDKNFTESFGTAGSKNNISFINVSLQNGPYVSIIGDLHAGKQLILQGESKVIADYVMTGSNIQIVNAKSKLKETGAVSQNSSCVPVFPKPVISNPANNSSNNIIIANNKTLSLSPGDYLKIDQKANSSLILSSGIYNIDTWRFSDENSSVYFQSDGKPLIINVNKWQTQLKDNLRFINTVASNNSDVTVNYPGVSPVQFSKSVFQGRINAPNGEIVFDNLSRLEGSCYANKISFKNGSTFIDPEYLVPLNINPDCQAIPAIPSKAENSDNENEISELDWEIFPNPSDAYINILLRDTPTNCKVEVFNAVGQVIMSQDFINNNLMTLDITNYSKGLYFIKIQTDKKVFVKKIIKE